MMFSPQCCFTFQWNRFCYMTVFRLMKVQQYVCVCVCRQKRNSQGFWLSPFYLKLMIATIVPILIKSLNAFLVVFKEKCTCVVPFFILSYRPSQIIITVLYGGGLTRHLQEITRRWRMGGSFQIWASWHFLLLWHLFWHFMTQRPLVDICLNIFSPLFDKNALLTLKAKQSLRCWWFTKRWSWSIIVQHHHYQISFAISRSIMSHDSWPSAQYSFDLGMLLTLLTMIQIMIVIMMMKIVMMMMSVLYCMIVGVASYCFQLISARHASSLFRRLGFCQVFTFKFHLSLSPRFL